jgi:hypothetical protein
MTSEFSNYNKIHDFLNLIRQNPKNEVNYFFLDEENKFIVFGEKLKSLPVPHNKYYEKEQFYIHIDLPNKRVQFYAFDIKDYMSGERINEVGGTMSWSKEIEDSIYNFFVLNMKELSNATYPYSSLNDNKQIKPMQSYAPYDKTYDKTYQTHTYGTPYGSQAYKEREAFIDKVGDLLKTNKTSQTIDYISTTINKWSEEKKLTIIDDVLRLLNFDKLNIPAMVSVLEATKGIEGLKDRTFFYGKVREHIVKLKPNRVDMVLKRVA